MKHFTMALAAAIALSCSTIASAQQPPQVPEGIFYLKQDVDQYLAKDLLLTAKVHGADGKIVGDIEDLILNEYNQVVGVIMGVGGFLGMGEKRIGVRYSALKFETKDGMTVVSLPTITREILKDMPAYVRSQPPKSLLDRVTERAKELTAKSTETAKDAYERAKIEADKAYKKATESVQEAYEKTKDPTEKGKEGSGSSN
jgi:hypothetical protein